MADGDWYSGSRARQRIMYQNVDTKIDFYTTKYDLKQGFLDKVHAACRMFIEGFDKLEQNRATGRQMTAWFENILNGSPVGDPAPAAPVFQTVNMPNGAFIGIEPEFREMMGFFKANPAYDKADGDDLMVTGTESSPENLTEAVPILKLDATLDSFITIEWKKSGFDALELQYRKAGTEMWQAAEKSTEKIIEFQPTGTIPGTPEKYEFRAVFLQKNQRVGQWSAIYSITIG